jgi:hypothetical protein
VKTRPKHKTPPPKLGEGSTAVARNEQKAVGGEGPPVAQRRASLARFPAEAPRPQSSPKFLRGFTLAHEIGHGFLGGHYETIADNVMHFQGSGSRFSPGQMFRAHDSATSILNTMFNAHPAALRRPCVETPGSIASVCPPTSFVLD